MGRLPAGESPRPSCQITRGSHVGRIRVGTGHVQSRDRSDSDSHTPVLGNRPAHVWILQGVVFVGLSCSPLGDNKTFWEGYVSLCLTLVEIRRPYLTALEFSFEMSGQDHCQRDKLMDNTPDSGIFPAGSEFLIFFSFCKRLSCQCIQKQAAQIINALLNSHLAATTLFCTFPNQWYPSLQISSDAWTVKT